MFQKALHYDTFPVYDLVMDDWLNWAQIGVTDLPTFILGTIAIVLLPGPNSLYVLTASSQGGWRSGVLKPLWLDTKTGNELLADLSTFVSSQAGKDIKVSLLDTH